MKSDLHPPESGLGSDPVLYGVAAGLADLFPPIVRRTRPVSESDPAEDEESEQD